MKKLMTLSLCLMFSAIMMAQSQRTVNVIAGGLGQALGPSKMSVTHLKITGEINGDDVRVLREMCGASGLLQDLDLSEVRIVNGGGRYFEGTTQDCYTHRNQITAHMFYNCSMLQRITLPDKTRSISHDAFSNCPNLREFRTTANCTKYTAVEGILYTADRETLVRCPEGLPLDEVEVTDGVHHIYTGAFYNYSKLRQVVLPSTIESVSNKAFIGCPLQSIMIRAKRAPAMENAFDASVVSNATLYIPRGSRESYLSANFWNKFSHMQEF